MIPGAVHRSPGIYLQPEKNPRKSHLGDSLMDAVRAVLASSEVPHHQMKSVISYLTSERDKDREKGANVHLIKVMPQAYVQTTIKCNWNRTTQR